MPPPILWPFPWWIAALLAVVAFSVPWLIATVRVRQRNRHIARLGEALRESEIRAGQDLFAIGEGQNIMIVGGRSLAVADTKSWRIVQQLTWENASILRIYHHNQNYIEFRLVIHGGSQTRKVQTYSLAGFGRLFIQATKEGKSIEYVQS